METSEKEKGKSKNSGAVLQQVPVADIYPTSDNQRKNIEKAEGFDDLVASIAGGGVRLAVQVRPHPDPDKKGKYELRAGERRYRAAKKAGVETIAAIVHTGLTDADAMDLTFIENKFRKDLKPMEEAAEVLLLTERFGGDIKKIAARIGQKERWVRLRANINANLIKGWKAIFENLDKHPSFRSWSVTHLTLIARLPATRQKQLLDDIDNRCNPKQMSAADLKEYIGREMKLLSKAKWELADETLLPKAGACSKCEKRSGHQPMLWFDSEEQAKAGDQCLDGLCYQAKQMALLQRTAAELRAKHPDLVYAASEYPDHHEARAISENLGTYISKYDYSTCSKSTKGAVPAMYVSGKSAGKLTFIKVNTGSGSGRAGKAKGVPTPLKVRRAMLDAKRWAQVLICLREKVAATKVKGLTFTDKITALMALVAAYGNKPLLLEYSYRYNPEKSKVGKGEITKLTKPKADKKRSLDLLWQSFQPTVDCLLTYNGPITQTPKNFIDDSKWIADMIGADIKAMFKEVSKRKGFTVPKSWAGLNENGTVKQVKSKKAKGKKSATESTEVTEKKATKKTAKKKSSKKDKFKKNSEGNCTHVPVETEPKKKIGTCRVCGCTDEKACLDKETGEPCHWVEKDLCSNCEHMAVKGKSVA